MKITKIKIKGAYGETNFGDDLLMCLFEKYFLSTFDNVELNFEGVVSEYPSKFLTNSKYNYFDFQEEWYIYGGGTQFFSYQSKNNTVISFINKTLKNPSRIIHKIKLKLLNSSISKPKYIAILAFGMGPFYDNETTIQKVKKKLSNVNFIGLRDTVSMNYCKMWGIDANFGADIAFSSYFDFKFKLAKTIPSKRKKIGLIVRDWKWEETGRAYYDPIFNLYKSSSEFFEFQFIIYAPDRDPYWMEKVNGENVLVWDPNKYSIESFLSELNDFDAFISARFHGSIVGAILGKPVICIEIEPKLRILTEDIKELVLWKKPFVLDDLKALLLNLDYSVDYEISLKNLKTRVDDMLLKFTNFFNKSRQQ